MRELKKIFTALILGFFSVVLICNGYVNRYSKKYLYNDPEKLPVNKYGLILGTNKYLSKGGINRYYTGRIESAVLLYQMGKIRNIYISGNGLSRFYNEPAGIKKELVQAGIPDSVIQTDRFGLRTHISVLHLRRDIHSEKITVISQKFHNERTVFLGKNYGIEMVAFNVPEKFTSDDLSTRIRETLAKTLAVFEMIFRKKK